MNAALIFDGTVVHLPPKASTPQENQFRGKPLEQLCEVACRECYDSFGKGRSSQALHEHVVEVNHGSVLEHAVITVSFDIVNNQLSADEIGALPWVLLNRKGVWIERNGPWLEVTANFRSILEWERYSTGVASHIVSEMIGDALWNYAFFSAPMIFPKMKIIDPKCPGVFLKEHGLSDNQAHISIWMHGSRGFTHEQVRHRFAISQRSTRYVDESESKYERHPLIMKYLEDQDIDFCDRLGVEALIEHTERCDKVAYRHLVKQLEKYLKNRGLDEISARKQARGAARGYLGNALASSMIFTASVADWQHMLRQRKSKPADAEIREIYSPTLDALNSSRYSDRFVEFTTMPSPDGIGTVLV